MYSDRYHGIPFGYANYNHSNIEYLPHNWILRYPFHNTVVHKCVDFSMDLLEIHIFKMRKLKIVYFELRSKHTCTFTQASIRSKCCYNQVNPNCVHFEPELILLINQYFNCFSCSPFSYFYRHLECLFLDNKLIECMNWFRNLRDAHCTCTPSLNWIFDIN